MGGVAAARRQKRSSLLAPFWVAKQGVGRRLCPYTWDPETPLAAARLVYLSTSSVLACTGLRYTRGSPTPPGGDAGAQSSTALPHSRQRPSVHRSVWRAPRTVLCSVQKRASLGSVSAAPPAALKILGLSPPRAAKLSPCWAAQMRPGERGERLGLYLPTPL